MPAHENGEAGPLRTILPDYDAIGLCARKAVPDRTIDAVGLCIYRAQLPPKCFNTLVDTDVTGTFSFLPPPLGLLHVRALRLFSGNKCGVDVPHHFVFHHCSLVDIEMTSPWPRHVNVSQITAKLRTFDYRVAHAG